LWIDDVRPAPEGYIWVKSVYDAKLVIETKEEMAQSCSDQAYMLENYGHFDMARRIGRCVKNSIIELIDIDHDAGEYSQYGGDYIKLLDWLEETGRNYPIRIHSMNVVGVDNMRAIIQRNGWTDVR
jgi:hypothetical protein